MNKLVLALLCLGVLAAGIRSGFAEELDLELVLLADATGSIDEAEIRFQRQGYAEAITDPAVLSAIASNAYGKIAITYVEWGSANSQQVVVDWTVIDGRASAEAFAASLMEQPRLAFGRNAIGAALLKGKELIDTNSYAGLRKVIDLSADSANNWNGPPIAEARAAVINSGIVINGLAVLCRHCSGRPAGYDLENRFANEIIGGPGAFVITADNAQTFADAVRRKLILEIADHRSDPEGLARFARASSGPVPVTLSP
ncbi:hypothetical protein GCM10011316_02600 [Roseibium aquae]|uniref:DUF1194 domain-containing protein n=1 Tax=Roseibium aquae TaxID=1323746 RepID=A0A916T6Y7_9HYPH|nr:DUF1194 domain-containing protein [Roseibium aquae]GGB33985.1 hypothetical protein GCM10011316_02600 [Roseibium aquae]